MISIIKKLPRHYHVLCDRCGIDAYIMKAAYDARGWETHECSNPEVVCTIPNDYNITEVKDTEGNFAGFDAEPPPYSDEAMTNECNNKHPIVADESKIETEKIVANKPKKHKR